MAEGIAPKAILAYLHQGGALHYTKTHNRAVLGTLTDMILVGTHHDWIVYQDTVTQMPINLRLSQMPVKANGKYIIPKVELEKAITMLG